MPLSETQATAVIRRGLPNRRIEPPIEYKDLYIFQAYDDSDPEEGFYDPFFSVNKTTGELREFSVITDGNAHEISAKFIKKQRGAK